MLLGLLLTSALGLYSGLHSSSVIHLPLSASLQSRTQVYRPHSELHVYLCYEFLELHSDVRSGVRSDIRVSIHLTSPSPTPSDPVSDLCPCPHYDLNPCHPTPLGGPLGCPLGCPLGHPCLTPSYKFEPVPSGPARTSVFVRVMSAVRIQTARNNLCGSAQHHFNTAQCCKPVGGGGFVFNCVGVHGM
jgi:hypothetical protein